jgi:FKBP-type peptidyl-prolyl cis-trans isomerase
MKRAVPRALLGLLVLALGAVAAAPAANPAVPDTTALPDSLSFRKLEARAKYTFSGLRFVVLREGAGARPVKGDELTVRYTGRLTDGTQFDEVQGRGFKFKVGEGRVIPGWDEALLDMRRGERRVLIIPPELGYGARRTGNIPPNSTLVFDVELVDF